MENKNIYAKTTLKGDSYDLSPFAPKNDYILILGTSHSCGVCVNEKAGKQFLDHQEQVWCYQVADALGLEVFNISVGGQTSLNMLAQFNDYFEYFDKSKCKMVIAEVRQHEGSEVFANDLIEDFTHDKRPLNKITPAIALGRDITAHGSLVDDVLLNRFVLNFDNKNYAKEMALSVTDNPSSTSISRLKQLMDTYTNVVATTSRDYIRDLIYIQALIGLSKAHNIPFYWFGWDNTFNDYDNKLFVDAGFEKVTNIFEHRFKCMPYSAYQSYKEVFGAEKTDSIQCDCGHYNEEMHAFVSQEIIKELTSNGN